MFKIMIIFSEISFLIHICARLTGKIGAKISQLKLAKSGFEPQNSKESSYFNKYKTSNNHMIYKKRYILFVRGYITNNAVFKKIYFSTTLPRFSKCY